MLTPLAQCFSVYHFQWVQVEQILQDGLCLRTLIMLGLTDKILRIQVLWMRTMWDVLITKRRSHQKLSMSRTL